MSSMIRLLSDSAASIQLPNVGQQFVTIRTRGVVGVDGGDARVEHRFLSQVGTAIVILLFSCRRWMCSRRMSGV